MKYRSKNIKESQDEKMKPSGFIVMFLGALSIIYGIVEKLSGKNQLQDAFSGITGSGLSRSPVEIIIIGIMAIIAGIIMVFKKA